MGYTVDYHEAFLDCRTEASCRVAVRIVEACRAICPYHLQVSAWAVSNPPRDDAWRLSIDHLAGDHWDETEARKLWVALAPHMANDASIEFQGEDGERWRIRWSAGRAYEEHVAEIRWAVTQELTPPQTGDSS